MQITQKYKFLILFISQVAFSQSMNVSACEVANLRSRALLKPL